MYGISETNYEKKIREQKIVDLEKLYLEDAIANNSSDIFQEEPTIEALENVEEELGD